MSLEQRERSQEEQARAFWGAMRNEREAGEWWG